MTQQNPLYTWLERTRRTDAPAGPPRALVTARRIATPIWLVSSALNFLVWLMTCMITMSIDSPWWLWGFIGGGGVVAGLAVACRSYGTPR